MAAISNLYIDSGTDYSTIITIAAAVGSPLDLTTYTVRSQMRKSYSSSTAFSFTATVVDPPAGKIKLAMTAAETTLIPAGRYLYDVEITDNLGIKKRVVEGLTIVTAQITQT